MNDEKCMYVVVIAYRGRKVTWISIKTRKLLFLKKYLNVCMNVRMLNMYVCIIFIIYIHTPTHDMYGPVYA